MFNDCKGNCIHLEEFGRPFMPPILKREELNDVIAKEAVSRFNAIPENDTTSWLANERTSRASLRRGTEFASSAVKINGAPSPVEVRARVKKRKINSSFLFFVQNS